MYMYMYGVWAVHIQSGTAYACGAAIAAVGMSSEYPYSSYSNYSLPFRTILGPLSRLAIRSLYPAEGQRTVYTYTYIHMYIHTCTELYVQGSFVPGTGGLGRHVYICLSSIHLYVYLSM